MKFFVIACCTLALSEGRRKRISRQRDDGPLRKVMLPEGKYEGGKCMDGTQAGYFYRGGSTNMWVIHLAGGGGCDSKTRCKAWLEKPTSTMGPKGSSSEWTDTRTGRDDLSSSPHSNPVFHKAHHVYVPYCTADGWTGQVGTLDPANAPWGDYYFDGHLNIKAILAHLHETQPAFANMDTMLLQGLSAGGIGVFRNCDFVGSEVREKVGEHAQVKCNPVAGWYLPGFAEDNSDPRAPPTPWDLWSTGQAAPPPPDANPSGPQKPYYPPACLAALGPADKPWLCGSVTVLFPTIQQPVFVTQDIWDYSHLHGMLGMPRGELTSCKGQEFMRYYGKAVVNSTALVSEVKPGDGLFLTSCYEHGSDGNAMVQGRNKFDALNAWFSNDGSVPPVLVDECHASTGNWLPCGQGCETIPPNDDCDGGGSPSPGPPSGGDCQDVLASLCTQSTERQCLRCARGKEEELGKAGCTRAAVEQFCAQAR